jgi:hypothetical protein
MRIHPRLARAAPLCGAVHRVLQRICTSGWGDRYNENCTFTDVTDKTGVGGGGWSSSAVWVDSDSDGLLDLVVDLYVTWDWEDI